MSIRLYKLDKSILFNNIRIHFRCMNKQYLNRKVNFTSKPSLHMLYFGVVQTKATNIYLWNIHIRCYDYVESEQTEIYIAPNKTWHVNIHFSLPTIRKLQRYDVILLLEIFASQNKYFIISWKDLADVHGLIFSFGILIYHSPTWLSFSDILSFRFSLLNFFWSLTLFHFSFIWIYLTCQEKYNF